MPRKRLKDEGLPRRVYKKGKSYFYVTPPPTVQWIKLGETLPEMHRRLAEVLSQPRELILRLIFERYEREVIPTKAPATQEAQQRQLATLKRVYGHMRPQDVSTVDIASYLDTRSKKVAANREIALLSHIYTKAIRWGLVDRNPCDKVEKNTERPDTRYITDAEFVAVYRRATPEIRNVMALALFTGQRQADILSLQRSQLGPEGIFFRQQKTGKALVVRWSSALRRAVNRALRQPSSVTSFTYVIHTRKGQKYTSSGFQTNWQKLIRRCMEEGALSERFTFRAIRAKARSDGRDDKLLGHANPAAMARIYQRKPVLVEPVK